MVLAFVLCLICVCWPCVKATEDQSCAACKVTTRVYLAKALKLIEKKKTTGSYKMDEDSKAVLDEVCKDETFNNYAPALKETCLDLALRHAQDFKQIFTNNLFNQDGLKDISQQIDYAKEICIDKYAVCPQTAFDMFKTPPPAKTVAKCAACNIIADEIENIKSLLVAKKWVGKKRADPLKDALESTFCTDLAYYFEKSSWLEKVCDEMVFDTLDEVLQILAEGGALCKELYKCKQSEKEEL